MHLFLSGKDTISSFCGFTQFEGKLARQADRQTKHKHIVLSVHCTAARVSDLRLSTCKHE